MWCKQSAVTVEIEIFSRAFLGSFFRLLTNELKIPKFKKVFVIQVDNYNENKLLYIELYPFFYVSLG